MVAIVTLLFGLALFLLIRVLQVNRLNSIAVKNLLEKSKNVESRLYVFKKTAVKIVSKYISRLPIEQYRIYLNKKIVHSHAKNTYTADEFLAYKIILAVSGALIYLGLFNCLDFVSIMAVLVLFMLPEVELEEAKQKYEKSILRELPYAIDIITLCVEAGLTFDSAVAKYVSREEKTVLQAEFEQYLRNLGLGMSRETALKDISSRVNLHDFTSLVCSILQSEKLGTGIAKILRLQNIEIRIKRKQRVEKLAMQTPVKLMLPLVIFILPVVFIVIIGPIAIKLFSHFNK